MKLLRALVLSVAAITVAAAPPALADPQRAQVDELKAVYLSCDRVASRTILDMAAAAFCSRYAEELLRRGFAGDFDTLLAWWREAKEQAIASEARDPSAAVELGAATTH